MINKRLVAFFATTKKWIWATVLLNWLALCCSIVMAFGFALILQTIYQASVTKQQIIIFIIVMLVALAIKVVTIRAANYFACLASVQVKTTLRNQLYHKLLDIALDGKQDAGNSATVVQLASEGVEHLEVYFGRFLPQYYYAMLAPLTLFAVLFFVNSQTAVVLLICVPLIPISIIVVNKIARKLLTKYWAIYTGLSSSFLDNLQGLTTLKVYQDDGYKAQQMAAEAKRFREITMKVLTMQLNSVTLMDLLAYGGAAVGIITALAQFQAGSMPLYGVIVVILLAVEFFIPMRLLGSFFHVATHGNAAAEQIFKILDIPTSLTTNTKSTLTSPVQIEITDLDFSYAGQETAIFKQLNLIIKPQAITVFAGKSGCGKSTLAALLLGWQSQFSGKICLNSISIKDIAKDDFYRDVTIVSHSNFIFNSSVRDNLLLAMPNATDEQLYQALAAVDLKDFILANGGLDFVISSNASNLSGGQAQRIALARAILHDAKIYIFDEATSNIDVESEEIILRYIAQLKQYKTVILITHRLANALMAEQIYMLEQGLVVESGNPNQLLQQEGLFAQLYQQQQQLETIRNVPVVESKT